MNRTGLWLQDSPSRSKTWIFHFTALPWREIGAFVGTLRKQIGTAARALEFAILTAARSSEVRGATSWAEIDLDAGL